MSTINEVKDWAAAGDSTKIIRAKLTIAGLEDKAISALIKEAGIGRQTAGFTQTNTLAFLEDGVSEYDLYQVILENEARNEARWIGDRNRIRMTLNRVHEKLGGAVAEKAATKDQKEAIKKLVTK